jgi:plastocyanin
VRTRLPVLATLVLPGLVLAGCAGSKSTTTPKAATTTAPAAATTAPAQPSGDAIRIGNFAYSPTPLTVAPGATVSAKNVDGTEHTVTSDTTGLFNASDIGTGKTVTFTAPAKAGSYTYHCTYHSSMHGTLVVKG